MSLTGNSAKPYNSKDLGPTTNPRQPKPGSLTTMRLQTEAFGCPNPLTDKSLVKLLDDLFIREPETGRDPKAPCAHIVGT